MKNSIVFLVFVLMTSLTFAQINQVDSKGRKQGDWQKKYPDRNVLMYKGQFKNDKPVGKFTYFYESSKVKAVIIHQENSNRSTAYFYHENGSLMSHGIYRNQVKDSLWVNFGPSERLSNTENFVNGKLQGKKVVYFVPEIITDKSQIPSAIYTYEEGVLNGPFIEYFDGKAKKTIGQYKNDKKVGIWTRYHANGRKMSVSRYKEGRRHGWQVSYDKSGNETAKNYFYYGKILQGEELKRKMAQMKELGINPNE